MSNLILYGNKGDKNVLKQLIVAKYVGVNLSVQDSSNLSKEQSPLGKTPVLETPLGPIFESNAIARYLVRISKNHYLYGETPEEEAIIETWMELAASEIEPPLVSWHDGRSGTLTYDNKIELAAIKQLESVLKVVDNLFLGTTFLVGHRVTLADIVLATTLLDGFTKIFDAGFRKQIPHLERYFLTIINQPILRHILGDVKLADKAIDVPKGAAVKSKDVPKQQQQQQQAKAEKKQQQPSAQAKKEAAATSTTTAAPTPAQAQPEEEKPKDKPKNPLDLLPPSSMILDSWKRLYSNTPATKFREIACKGLWNGADIPNSPNQERFNGFDFDGFSVWTLEYKYPEENTVNFIVMNKVGGFYQRIDYARKYIFGVTCILKDAAQGVFPIRGFFIFRGQGIPPQIQENCPDLELYEWKKVDPSELKTETKTRARLEDMLAEEDKIDGLEHVECKVFK